VYWLSGLAGTGKSTIARTVARRLHDQNRLAASFFFSKGGGDVGHARKFATSIAFQLTSSVPATRKHICEVITKHDNISTLSLRDQWQKLVLKPLSALNRTDGTTSLVLVIDALDECDVDSIEAVVELLTGIQALSEANLRVFMTSRPEAAIRHHFGLMLDTSCRSSRLHHIPNDVVNADIEHFLTQKLRIIGQQQYLLADWPGSEMVARMTKRAGGLFIWAATTHRFIQEGKSFAARRLESIMQQNSDGPVGPEKHLDNLYLTILRDSLSPNYKPEEKKEHCRMLRLVLGTLVVLEVPLTVQALGGLLNVGKEAIERTVQDLHAILDIPEDDHQMLRLHHPSLREFLLDRSRCTDVNFCTDEAKAHGVLASRCIERMTRFIQQGTEACINGPEDFMEHVRPAVLELAYACSCSNRHLERSGHRLAKSIRPWHDTRSHYLLRYFGYSLWHLYRETRYSTRLVISFARGNPLRYSGKMYEAMLVDCRVALSVFRVLEAELQLEQYPRELPGLAWRKPEREWTYRLDFYTSKLPEKIYAQPPVDGSRVS